MTKPPPAMPTPAGLSTLRRLGRALRTFLGSDAGPRARLLVAALLLLMLCINGMNVLNSFVGRDFMSAIEARDRAGFIRYAWSYAAVFALSTLVAVLFRFAEERLALLWRGWLTRRAVNFYLDGRAYLHLKEAGVMSNPDQRISEDIRALTISTISLTLMMVNGTVTALSFSGVLWSISPALFGVAVLYAGAGSALTILLGRPLVRLNYQQSDREADFRAELIRVREDADGIACTDGEPGLRRQLLARVDALVGNLRGIIAVNRNLGFFTTGYNYLIQLIPALFVAPMFIDGKVEFGIIGQAAMAFATLLGAFSLVVTQFQAISSYASVATRLGEFTDALEGETARPAPPLIRFDAAAAAVTFEQLTLLADGEPAQAVLRELDGALQPGRRWLITGPNETGVRMLMRAAAGLHHAGSGAIHRPPQGRVVFLPERSFLPPGTLRQLLDPAGEASPLPDGELAAVLAEAGLDGLVNRSGGLDSACDWDDTLSVADQQRLAAARAALAKPVFAWFEHPASVLDAEELHGVLGLLERRGITCIAGADESGDRAGFDGVLEILTDGSWRWSGGGPAAA